uniref:pilus assembly protein TadG-related protein n=1 Tax=Sphingomonas sp. TaxID=28214 RepID=UPI003B3BCFDD
MTWLGRLRASERGSIMVMGAMALVAAIGMSGLAVEVGNAYSVKVQHQRVADVAALAAALAYLTAPTAGTLDAAAKDVALANGLARATTTAVLSPDKSKVTVTVLGAVPLVLTRVLGSGVSLPIRNEAVASLVAADTGGGACFLALKGSVANGIVQSGGVTIEATDCGVATNAGVALESSSTVIQNASEVLIGKSLSGQKSWIRNTKPENIKDGRGTPAADPYANDAKLQQAFAALGSFTQPASPTAPPAVSSPPSCSGPPVTLRYNNPELVPGMTRTSQYGGDFVAQGGRTYTIDKLALEGGTTLTFQGSATVNICGGGGVAIVNDGNKLQFAGGTFNIRGSVKTGSA